MNRNRLIASPGSLTVFAAVLAWGAVDGQIPGPRTLSPTQKAAPPAASQPASNTAAQLTPADLGPFLDGVVLYQLKRENIAGAVVLIVKDGQVLFQKGYSQECVDYDIRAS